MVDIARLKAANAARWAAMQVHPYFLQALDHVAAQLIADGAKHRYQAVADQTSVPWYVIAVIHEREASQSWAANLAQGDPWNRVSIHVPRGRGPFASWEAAAVDALENCAPRAAHWIDWSPGGLFTILEEYNGLGYAAMGMPSPYIWASTDQYVRGKYVSDGHYDPHAVDQQLGCAALLRRMMAADSSISISVGTGQS